MAYINILIDNKKYKRIKINVSRDLKRINKGGQAGIFQFIYNNKPYLIKAMPEAQGIYRRLRSIGAALRDEKTKRIPLSIYFRGVPVGQGFGKPEEFGMVEGTQVNLIMFRYIYGEPLDMRLEKEAPLSALRKKIVSRVLDILIYLQKHNVVHNDLYPDNFLVDQKNRVFLLDLEGAGVIKKGGTSWIWEPTVLGKPFLFPMAPELKNNVEKASFYSDRWLGAYLIFWILVGVHPFAFLKKSDIKTIETLYMASDEDVEKWPPKIIKPFKYLRDDYPIENFDALMNEYFGDTTFGKMLFLTYIKGFKNPEARPSFEEFKSSLWRILKDV